MGDFDYHPLLYKVKNSIDLYLGKMKYQNKEVYLEFVIVMLIIVFYLSVIKLTTSSLVPTHPDFANPTWDHHWYIEMASNPIVVLKQTINAPYCYRILMPILVWLMPFDLTLNFQILTMLFLFFSGLILYIILKESYSKILSLAGLTLFYTSPWIAKFLIYDFWLTDSITFFFILLCFFAIIKSNTILYCVSLFLGVLSKEIMLFTIPVFLISEYIKMNQKGLFKKRYILRCLSAILPGFIIYIVIRIIIRQPNIEYISIFPFDLREITRFILTLSIPIYYYVYTFSTWGIICTIFPLANKKSILLTWLKQYGVFIGLIYCQLLIAADNERILIAGFFPIILLTVSGFERVCIKKNISQLYFMALCIICFIMNIIIGPIFSLFIRF